jgi:hypothetical protein
MNRTVKKHDLIAWQSQEGDIVRTAVLLVLPSPASATTAGDPQAGLHNRSEPRRVTAIE